MKIRTSLVHLTALCFLTCGALAQNESPQAHIVSLTLDPQSVTVLHLHPERQLRRGLRWHLKAGQCRRMQRE